MHDGEHTVSAEFAAADCYVVDDLHVDACGLFFWPY
jgi:hypothetical protein